MDGITYAPANTGHYLFSDLTDRKVGRLTVVKLLGRHKGNIFWLCRCECGNSHAVKSTHLNRSIVKSCGCYNSDAVRARLTTHGQSVGNGTKEYQAWLGMKDRCYNVNDQAYANYGGRGITVCDRWLESFQNFFADMGSAPSVQHSVDRVNNDKGYGPDNCEWASKKQQGTNTRQCVTITYNGKEYPSLTVLAADLGVNYDALKYQLRRRKLTVAEALNKLQKSGQA